jgi:hypothetical protein
LATTAAALPLPLVLFLGFDLLLDLPLPLPFRELFEDCARAGAASLECLNRQSRPLLHVLVFQKRQIGLGSCDDEAVAAPLNFFLSISARFSCASCEYLQSFPLLHSFLTNAKQMRLDLSLLFTGLVALATIVAVATGGVLL